MDHRAYNEEMMRQLASMINAQFDKLNKKVDEINTKIDTEKHATALQFTNISTRLDSLAASVTNISQTINTSAVPPNPARTTESPSTLESEPHEEKPNIIRAAAATTPTAPAANVIPTPVVAQPAAPVAAAHVPTAPVTAAPVHRPVRQITSPPVAQTAVPEGVARTMTEPGSWPEQPAEPVAAQNPAPVRRSNGSSDAGAARIPQAPQPAAASTVQTVVPPPQTLAQALQNVEESRESPAPNGSLPNEEDLLQIMTTVPKKRVRAHHEQVYVYDIFFALYVKLFRSNEEPLQYLPLATAKGQSAMFDGDMLVPMGLVQFQLKHIINLIRTLPEYQDVEQKKPTLIQRNLRVNTVNRLKSIRKMVFQQMTETAMRTEYANNNAQRHPETPANAALFEPLKRTVSSDSSGVSGASGSGVEGSGAAESDADGAEIYDPNNDDEEFVQILFSRYADPNLPENKKNLEEMAARIARVKAEPEDDYERPVVHPPTSSNATSSAKTTAAPAPAAAAAAAGGKNKITPGEREILARTLSATTMQAAREAPRPIPTVNATPASSAAVNRPPAAVPHGTRAGTVNPRAHIASAPIRTEQHFSNGPIRIEHQQNPRVGRQEPGLVNPIQQYPGGPILVRPSMLTNLAPMNYTISGYPNGAHPRSRPMTSQNYAPHPTYGVPSGGQFQQLPTKRAYDMGQQPIRGPPAAKYQRY